MPFTIEPAYQHLDTVRILFTEYTNALGLDLSFQSYDQELADLPGKYAPPRGRLLLAWQDGEAAGCAALRPFDQERAEMKRFYVRPQFRKLGIGRALATRIIDEAAALSYQHLILDTQIRLDSSVRLYRSLGFTDIEPYYPNPYPDVLYLGLLLRTPRQS